MVIESIFNFTKKFTAARRQHVCVMPRSQHFVVSDDMFTIYALFVASVEYREESFTEC